jgi:hypothetical protein
MVRRVAFSRNDRKGNLKSVSGWLGCHKEATVSWWSATLRSVSIFGYFVVFTVWLPAWLLRVDAVASSSGWIRDGIAVAVWGVALIAGLAGLRVAQQRGLI